TLFAPKPLVRLLQTLSDKVRVIDTLDGDRSYDCQIALLSLPLRLKTELSNIPGQVPYLGFDADRVARWRDVLGDGGFRIGIACEGNPQVEFDKTRSVAVREFMPLSQIPGVRLISLQKNFGTEQLQALPEGMTVETLGDDYDAGPDAFRDTAAVMQH